MSTFNELTNQERRVLALVAQGKRNAAIAAELSISSRTVETHVYRIFDKLNVSTRTEAAVYLLRYTSKISRNSDDAMPDPRYAGKQHERFYARTAENFFEENS